MKIEETKIISIEELTAFDEEYVYDIEMENDTFHTFFANDILVHNSTHLTMMPLVNSLNLPLLVDNQINPDLYQHIYSLQAAINKGITDWAQRYLNSKDPRFVFKREAICEVGAYQSKKHYILHIRDKGEDKPIPCDTMKYVGVEVAKSTMSDEVKKLVKHVVETMLRTKDKKVTDKAFKAAYEEYKQLTLDAIAFRNSINNYEKYDKNRDGFIMGKGTPVHVKAAIFHNLLLDELNIATKYDKIASAQKIKWLYTNKTNKFRIRSIGWIGSFPEEFADLLVPDYDTMFEKSIKPAIIRMYECAQWSVPDIKNEYQCDLFELFGI